MTKPMNKTQIIMSIFFWAALFGFGVCMFMDKYSSNLAWVVGVLIFVVGMCGTMGKLMTEDRCDITLKQKEKNK